MEAELPLGIKIKSIELAGSKLDLTGDDLVVLTGPNNVGKSQCLRDIYGHLRGDNVTKIVIKNMVFERLFNGEEFEKVILTRFPRAIKSDGTFQMFGLYLPPSMLRQMEFQPLGGMADLFCYFAHTGSRLLEVTPAAMFDRTTDSPELPFQRMYLDDRLEEAVSSRFRKAFGVGLVLHRTAGSQIPVYVGDKPDWTKENDRLSTEYAEKIERLPRIENQGDGMKAFAGLLLRIMVFDRSIILIDEPEAFLHPPQARLVGRLIAEERAQGRQIFVATHSSDVIQGIVESRPKNLRLGRLIKKDAGNRIDWLNPDNTERFITDSLLRTSNALLGLFHDRVVLCEGDRDAVFYKEILSSCTLSSSKKNDVLFINTNGKDRMPDS